MPIHGAELQLPGTSSVALLRPPGCASAAARGRRRRALARRVRLVERGGAGGAPSGARERARETFAPEYARLEFFLGSRARRCDDTSFSVALRDTHWEARRLAARSARASAGIRATAPRSIGIFNATSTRSHAPSTRRRARKQRAEVARSTFFRLLPSYLARRRRRRRPPASRCGTRHVSGSRPACMTKLLRRRRRRRSLDKIRTPSPLPPKLKGRHRRRRTVGARANSIFRGGSRCAKNANSRHLASRSRGRRRRRRFARETFSA